MFDFDFDFDFDGLDFIGAGGEGCGVFLAFSVVIAAVSMLITQWAVVILTGVCAIITLLCAISGLRSRKRQWQKALLFCVGSLALLGAVYCGYLSKIHLEHMEQQWAAQQQLELEEQRLEAEKQAAAEAEAQRIGAWGRLKKWAFGEKVEADD